MLAIGTTALAKACSDAWYTELAGTATAVTIWEVMDDTERTRWRKVAQAAAALLVEAMAGE